MNQLLFFDDEIAIFLVNGALHFHHLQNQREGLQYQNYFALYIVKDGDNTDRCHFVDVYVKHFSLKSFH